MSEHHTPNERAATPSHHEAQERAERHRERFYELVIKTIDNLPPVFQEKLDNLDVVIADWPSPVQLAKAKINNRFGLLGLYEGVPHTRRGRSYGMVLPDKITIFRNPIEARCHSWSEIEQEIENVVWHEIAHHFGTDEKTLRTIESNRRKRDTT